MINAMEHANADRLNQGGVVCGMEEASCICIREPHDEHEPHECKCGGSWQIDENDEFRIVRFPQRLG